MKHAKYFLLVLVLMAAVGLAGCDALAGAGKPASTDLPEATAVSNRAVGNLPMDANLISAEGRIVPRDSAWLGLKREGTVAEVLVEEGQQVKMGEVLMRLDDREAVEAQVEAAELEVLSAQQALDELQRQAGLMGGQAWQALAEAQRARADAKQALDEIDTDEQKDKIDDAWVKVQDEKDALEDAQEDFDKYKELESDNNTRVNAENALEEAQDRYDEAVHEHELLVNDLEKARADLEKAEAALAEAQHDYEARKDGPDPDDLALAQARLENANAQLKAAQANQADLDLTAPFDGTVVRLDVAAGERVSPGQMIVQLADFSTLYVETSDLTELDVVKIDTAQPVSITPDALPELRLTGAVERVRDDYSEKAGDVLYTVRVRLSDPDPRLRWGMTVNTEFQKK